MKSDSTSFLRTFARGSAWVLAGLLFIVAAAAATVYAATHHRLKSKLVVDVRPVVVVHEESVIAHGKHIADTRGCADCHGADFGGRAVIEDPMVGELHAPNITRGRGGLPESYGDLDYVRAIRHGLASDGRPLLLMPSLEYTGLSDQDLGALVAYLKTLPAVDRERGPVAPGPVARVLLFKGDMKLAAEEIDHAAVRPAQVVPGVTVSYGQYLAASCTGCHGENFSGGRIPGGPPDWPAAANLTPHASSRVVTWTEADFFRALREGVRPDGTRLSPVMPAVYSQFTDEETKALWVYLRSLPATATGARAH